MKLKLLFSFLLYLELKVEGEAGLDDVVPKEWDEELRRELSPDTYYDLVQSFDSNNTVQPLKIENITGNLERRFNDYKKEAEIHPKTSDSVRKACFMMAVTTRSAMKHLKFYFSMRTLYHDVLEYEVGYMASQIIAKYQKVVEIYNLVVRKYGNQNHTSVAPSQYMFYMYTNIFQYCWHIQHMCNMMHELPDKYLEPRNTIFDDYHLESESEALKRYNEELEKELKQSGNTKEAQALAKKKAEAEARKKKLEKRLKEKKALNSLEKVILDMMKTNNTFTPPKVEKRKPPRIVNSEEERILQLPIIEKDKMQDRLPSHKIYGWSIENWWQ